MSSSARSISGFLLALATAASATAGIIACANVIDVKELPLRLTDSGTTNVDANQDAGCLPRSETFCGKLCPVPDFCDDFEGESEKFERWNGNSLDIPRDPRFEDSDASSIRLTDDPSMNGRVIEAKVHCENGDPSIAYVLHTMLAPDGRLPRGLKVHFESRLPKVDFLDTDQDRDKKYLFTFVVADFSANVGLAISLLEHQGDKGKLDITAQQRKLVGGLSAQSDELGLILDTEAETLAVRSFAYDIMIAKPELLGELGIPCKLESTDAAPDALRMVVSQPTGSQCFPVLNELGSGQWLHKPSIVTGAAIGDDGSAVVHIDNIAAYFIW